MKKIFKLLAFCFCLILISTQCSGGNIKPVLNEAITPDEKNIASQGEPETTPYITPDTSDTSTKVAPTEIHPTPTPAPIFIQDEPIESFQFQALDGTTIKSSEQLGKPLIIVAWRASCPFCKRYLPMLQDVYEKYSADFEIWALNFRDSPEVIRQYVADKGLTFPIWPDEKGEVFYSNNFRTTPTTIFINRDGVVESIQEGIIAEEAFIAKLEALEFIQK